MAEALAYVDAAGSPDANSALTSVAGHLWRRGYSGELISGALIAVNAQRYHKPIARVRKLVRWLARKPRDGTAGRPHRLEPQVVANLDALEAAIRSRRWNGRAGKRARAVLQAHLAICRRIGRLDHGASVREVAERTGWAASRVAVAHHALVEDGWLVLVQSPRPGRDKTATGWLLQLPRSPRGGKGNCDRPAQSATRDSGVPDCIGLPQFGHDLFRERHGDARGLGKSCPTVMTALDAAPVPSVSEWARRADVDRRTIQRWLPMLVKLGLVVRKGRRAFERGPTTLDEAAAQLQVTGASAARERQHEAEREAYLDRLAKLDRRAGRQWRGRLVLITTSPPPEPVWDPGETCIMVRRLGAVG